MRTRLKKLEVSMQDKQYRPYSLKADDTGYKLQAGEEIISFKDSDDVIDYLDSNDIAGKIPISDLANVYKDYLKRGFINE